MWSWLVVMFLLCTGVANPQQQKKDERTFPRMIRTRLSGCTHQIIGTGRVVALLHLRSDLVVRLGDHVRKIHPPRVVTQPALRTHTKPFKADVDLVLVAGYDH
jgi:hypothetical protein